MLVSEKVTNHFLVMSLRGKRNRCYGSMRPKSYKKD
jgi:hypothetical protein